MMFVVPKGQPIARSSLETLDADGNVIEHRHYTVLRSGTWKWNTPKRCRREYCRGLRAQRGGR